VIHSYPLKAIAVSPSVAENQQMAGERIASVLRFAITDKPLNGPAHIKIFVMRVGLNQNLPAVVSSLSVIVSSVLKGSHFQDFQREPFHGGTNFSIPAN
jgi:hypothetical protein